MGSKINVLAMAAALGAFFLPWIQVSCTAEGEKVVMVSQTGVQAVTGKVEPGKKFKEMAESMGGEASKESDEKADKAVFVGVAAVLVVLGLLLSLIGAASGGGQRTVVGILAAAALALIALQMVTKFPMVKDMHDKRESDEVAAQMRNIVKDSYQPGIFVALGALVIPVVGSVVGRKGCYG